MEQIELITEQERSNQKSIKPWISGPKQNSQRKRKVCGSRIFCTPYVTKHEVETGHGLESGQQSGLLLSTTSRKNLYKAQYVMAYNNLILLRMLILC